MTNQKVLFAKILMFGIALTEFYAEFSHNILLTTYTKPFLLPTITLYFVLSVNGNWNATLKLMMGALFFSWIGDVSLMLTPDSETDFSALGIAKNKNYFLLGLSAFLINHLFLISAFRKSWQQQTLTLFHKNKRYFLPLIVFCVVMILLIVPQVYRNPEKSVAAVPVAVYTMIITTMACFALNRLGTVNSTSFTLVFTGALFFLFSDSCIAINFLAFPGSIPQPGFVIITTYFVAVYLITEGMLKQFDDR